MHKTLDEVKMGDRLAYRIGHIINRLNKNEWFDVWFLKDRIQVKHLGYFQVVDKRFVFVHNDCGLVMPLQIKLLKICELIKKKLNGEG